MWSYIVFLWDIRSWVVSMLTCFWKCCSVCLAFVNPSASVAAATYCLGLYFAGSIFRKRASISAVWPPAYLYFSQIQIWAIQSRVTNRHLVHFHQHVLRLGYLRALLFGKVTFAKLQSFACAFWWVMASTKFVKHQLEYLILLFLESSSASASVKLEFWTIELHTFIFVSREHKKAERTDTHKRDRLSITISKRKHE